MRLRNPWRKANPAIGPRIWGEGLDKAIENLESRPRPQAFAERVHYGNGNTIHHTGTIDIQVDDETGEIVAVWFRCLDLPFRISKAGPGRSQVHNPRDRFIEEITYQRREESSQ